MAGETGVLSNLSTGNLIGAGISLLPAIFKGVSSIFQKNKANKINPVNPNYQMNQGVISNAESLRNRVGNYIMPNYNKSMQDIEGAATTGFNNGLQGASSSGDVLDLASKIAYGQASATNDLNARNAQGRENAYLQSLEGNAAEGREYQAKNAYDRENYMQQLREKAGLTQASNENAYGAINTAAGVASNLLMQPKNQGQTTVTGNPYNSIFNKTAPTNPLEDYRTQLMQQYNSPYNSPQQRIG